MMINSSSNAAPVNSITILGYGSLLSEQSSRTTFPDLAHFRLVRIHGYRRVFCHPGANFLRLGIIPDVSTKELTSLSVEQAPAASFIAAAFEVPNNDMMQANGIPSQAFLEREREYDIRQVPFTEMDGEEKLGVLCCQSTDEIYLERWGQAFFDEAYGKYGITTIWDYPLDSGLRPCAVYLRHCYLAASKMGPDCLDSFLDETFLVDRSTSVRRYLEQHPEVLEALPPKELADRWGG